MKGALAETYTDLCKSNKWYGTYLFILCGMQYWYSLLQGNEQAFTLFNFCINPSHKDSVQIQQQACTVVEPSIHDNAGEDDVSVSTIVCTSPEVPPPNQFEPTAVASPTMLSSSPDQSSAAFLGGNN